MAERKPRCGIMRSVFGVRSFWPRRLTSPSPSPTATKTQTGNVHDHGDNFSNSEPDHKHGDRIIQRPGQNYTKSTPITQQNQARNAHSTPTTTTSQQNYIQARKVPQSGPSLSGELESMITDNQKSKGAGKVMLLGNLGNLRSSNDVVNSANVVDTLQVNGKYSYSAKKNEEHEKPVSLCRALSTRMDPEELKILGNEDYKNGRFAEAVALYEAAISIDPNKASYRSNKSAALSALGKLLEAAFECREAIRIDPFYQRAHNRLATLYVRLGEPEKGLYHFKQAGADADPDAMNMARNVQNHLNKCTGAKTQRDWNTLVKETGLAIAAGADSAPLIFALKAEALLKLNKHQEAVQRMANGPNFTIDDCTKFFGPIASASLLLVQAQVDMLEGRLDDACSAAERATRLDSNNREANTIMRKTRGVAMARSKGNEFFKAGKYQEACVAYGEGLHHDPYNALLLCNRAACRSKLSKYHEAIEDCNNALNVRPIYSKARLRRANCYAKVKNWGACVRDCEVLMREKPDDEEVGRILREAKAELQRRQG